MFEADVQLPESAEGTRQRLLDAAGEVFAEKGYREATIREICKRAGANIASINYHFGGKEHLYSDVLRYVDTIAAERHPHVLPELAKMPPEKRLGWFVLQFIKRVFDTDRPAWHERLMNREMVEPTFALDELADRNIKARSLVLQGIVRELLGPGATDQEVQRGAGSVVGQCLFYWHCRPVITRIMPHVGFGPGNVDGIAEHITVFSLHALRGLRADRVAAGMTAGVAARGAA